MSEVQYQFTYVTLFTWSKVHQVFLKVKDNKTALYGLIAAAVLLIALVFVLVSGSEGGLGGRGSLGFDPYDVLGVGKNATKREVKKQYRKLSQIYHPDVTQEQDVNKARAQFLKIQQSQEILLDDTKRQNYELYGDPDPQWLFMTFPSWIMNPGQTFLLFYFMLGLAFFSVPIIFLVLNPSMYEPPSWIRQKIYKDIQKAEQCLVNDELEQCRTYLVQAQNTWDKLVNTFPGYKTSEWYGHIDFHIVARRAQSYLFENDLASATKEMEEFGQVHNKSTSLESMDVQYIISPMVKDLRVTIQDMKDVTPQPTLSKTKGKGKSSKATKTPTTPVSPAEKRVTVNDFVRALSVVAAMPKMKEYQ